MTRMLFLVIEFLDELVFGIVEAAKPVIRNDLTLTYTQIGLLVFIPNLVSSIVEPFLGILGDVWKRKTLIITGGFFFCLALLLASISFKFIYLIIAFVIFFPASGAFVTLTQASLMDTDPTRRNQNMARWTLAGSLGVFLGPLFFGAILILGSNWRIALVILGSLSLVVVLWTRNRNSKYPEQFLQETNHLTWHTFLEGIITALNYLKNKAVIRWLVMLEFSDLMLDVLLGFIALYLVDVAHFSPRLAVIGVSVWTGVGLLGDLLIIPLLEKVRGLAYLRISVIIELALFPAFLLSNGILNKLIILGLVGFFTSGWYAILNGELYSSIPGKSGTVMSLNNISGLIGKFIPVLIGLVADKVSLGTAMWMLLAGPIVLLLGLNQFKPQRNEKLPNV